MLLPGALTWGFSNLISGRLADKVNNPTTLLSQAPLAFAFFCATTRRGGYAVVSRLLV
jgi:hypothetical protein